MHPPYSPDLAPANYFLFPKLKLAMKGTRFEDEEAIKRKVTTTLKGISVVDFSRYFRRLYERHQECINRGGNYVEH
ncbi:Histone-lysine N-methyltransferase SETMAR [Dufourea novaeangliae]|uniref:Histone-lysine N-methyltransferase SETMAR n=1 Tax=Dufourea novaeangliae TaxID=178035 RepID=A0A154PPV3_DUFNO|nr:Histone-lysine N-methyltransferase SETMAR [Dufourea novaeangliae]